MSHELEFVNGQASMAYAGETPWHGLGVRVSNDLTPVQMLEAANLDWTVSKIPALVTLPTGEQIDSGHSALVRNTDFKVLDVVTNDWNPVQNLEAFEFFNDFVAAGDMEMHTAGSLKDGKLCWCLAKVKDSFTILGGRDQVDSYLLFSNFHEYGNSTDIRFTPIRVVCNNTITMSLNTKSKNFTKVTHRREFSADRAKEAIGVAKEKLEKYREMAEYLSTKRYTNETIVDYFARVFPVTTSKKTEAKAEEKLSRNATAAVGEYLHNQPGVEFGEGSWWNAFNTVTYMTDHVIGRGADTRMASAWFGANKGLKQNALELAVEMADAS